MLDKMDKIASINIWQRTNDKRYSVCMTVIAGEPKRLSEALNFAHETPTRRIQFTSTNTNEIGLNEALEWIRTMRIEVNSYGKI